MTPDEKRILWQSLLIRSGLGLLAWAITMYSDLTLVSDARAYEALGSQIAEEWLWTGSSATLTGLVTDGRMAWGFVLLLACLSFVVGPRLGVIVSILVLSLLCAYTPVLTDRIGREIGLSPRGRRLATGLVIWSPVFAFWAGALYKEGPVLLSLNLIAYHVIRLQRNLSLRSVATIIAGLAVLLSHRFYLAGLIVPGIAVALLVGKLRSRADTPGEPVVITVAKQSFVVLMVGTILMTLGMADRILYFVPRDTLNFLYQVQASRNDLARAESGFLSDADVSSPIAATKFLPLGAFYFLTVPFPWELGSFRQNLVIPEMLLWLALYPAIFKGMRRGFKENPRATLALLAFTVPMIALYALYIGNSGTAYRMRSQVWLLWALFAGWGVAANEKNRDGARRGGERSLRRSDPPRREEPSAQRLTVTGSR